MGSLGCFWVGVGGANLKWMLKWRKWQSGTFIEYFFIYKMLLLIFTRILVLLTVAAP